MSSVVETGVFDFRKYEALIAEHEAIRKLISKWDIDSIVWLVEHVLDTHVKAESALNGGDGNG